jgi:hypothetical protein
VVESSVHGCAGNVHGPVGSHCLEAVAAHPKEQRNHLFAQLVQPCQQKTENDGVVRGGFGVCRACAGRARRGVGMCGSVHGSPCAANSARLAAAKIWFSLTSRERGLGESSECCVGWSGQGERHSHVVGNRGHRRSGLVHGRVQRVGPLTIVCNVGENRGDGTKVGCWAVQRW